eukprot:CAMPEP_0197436492 /NCGR_PEP_ID=MMETSP1175-20131217/3929_1 /TAXON_ID=1003142 /ORGANISM="Triceratium dubium, Strain CCMP147" /LENGTH=58 /DNA_ID=CAMNT_0042965793 /DNA_START=62 /DNA_END=234 /DNA_ORIENTATION=+
MSGNVESDAPKTKRLLVRKYQTVTETGDDDDLEVTTVETKTKEMPSVQDILNKAAASA